MDRQRVAAIFDMDGVLVDTYHAHFESWRMVAAEEGLELGEEQFATTFGRTSREIIAMLWAEDRYDQAGIAALDDHKEAAFRRIVAADFPAMPGVSELLKSLHRDSIALAIGSSGPAKNVRLVLDRLPPGAPFQAVVTGDDVTRGKPDPQVFLLAAERLEIPPNRCVVIEDAALGITAAQAAAMASVGLASTGRTRDELRSANLVVDRLDELSPDVLRALVGVS